MGTEAVGIMAAVVCMQLWREYQPAPQISKGTERLAKRKEELQLGFLERQNVLGEKQKQRAEKRRVGQEQRAS